MGHGGMREARIAEWATETLSPLLGPLAFVYGGV
jgi:hypothetical protein